jgi:protein MpaA
MSAQPAEQPPPEPEPPAASGDRPAESDLHTLLRIDAGRVERLEQVARTVRTRPGSLARTLLAGAIDTAHRRYHGRAPGTFPTPADPPVEPLTGGETVPAVAVRPPAQRGTTGWEPEEYGRSSQGRPLEVWLPADLDRCETLVVAALHGDESETAVLASAALRCLGQAGDLRAAVLVTANPDGLARGTRASATGVDLNRNFPTVDWQAGTVRHRWTRRSPQEVCLGTGDQAASEPEVRALMELTTRLRPTAVVALHAPLACVIDNDHSALGAALADATGLRLTPSIPYPLPGTFDTWVREQGIGSVTVEFPVISKDQLLERYLEPMLQLFTGRLTADSTTRPPPLP